jgi:flagellar hook-associated protein 1 FlgK
MKSITGVNMDEELINLTKLQRSYEASARIITVTDELMQTILGLIK